MLAEPKSASQRTAISASTCLRAAKGIDAEPLEASRNEAREKNLADLQDLLERPPVSARAWSQIALSSASSVAQNASKHAIYLGLLYASQKVTKWMGKEAVEASQQMTAFAFGSIAGEQVQQVGEHLISYVFPTEKAKDARNHQKVYEYLIERDALLDPEKHRELRANLKLFDDFYRPQVSEHSDPKALYTLLRLREGVVRALPQQIRNISHQTGQGDVARKLKIDGSVAALIGRYPEPMQADLKTLVARMRANCFMDKPEVAAAYLFGRPGTGKTYFARSLAKALGHPLIELSLSGKEEARIMGPSYPTLTLHGGMSDKVDELGALGELRAAYIEKGIKNPIVFIDEGGDEMRNLSTVSMLKKLLDPDNQGPKVPNLGSVEIDLSRVTFLISGNSRLSDAALRSRLKEIEFLSLPKEAKSKVICQEIEQSLTNHSQLDPGLRADVDQMVWSQLATIVAEDERQENPGVRVAQEVIRDLVSFVRDAYLSGDVPTGDALLGLIRSGFASRLPRRQL